MQQNEYGVYAYKLQMIKEKELRFTTVGNVSTCIDGDKLIRHAISELGQSDRENFLVAMMNTKLEPVGVNLVAMGSLNRCPIRSPRDHQGGLGSSVYRADVGAQPSVGEYFPVTGGHHGHPQDHHCRRFFRHRCRGSHHRGYELGALLLLFGARQLQNHETRSEEPDTKIINRSHYTYRESLLFKNPRPRQIPGSGVFYLVLMIFSDLSQSQVTFSVFSLVCLFTIGMRDRKASLTKS